MQDARVEFSAIPRNELRKRLKCKKCDEVQAIADKYSNGRAGIVLCERCEGIENHTQCMKCAIQTRNGNRKFIWSASEIILCKDCRAHEKARLMRRLHKAEVFRFENPGNTPCCGVAQYHTLKGTSTMVYGDTEVLWFCADLLKFPWRSEEEFILALQRVTDINPGSAISYAVEWKTEHEHKLEVDDAWSNFSVSAEGLEKLQKSLKKNETSRIILDKLIVNDPPQVPTHPTMHLLDNADASEASESDASNDDDAHEDPDDVSVDDDDNDEGQGDAGDAAADGTGGSAAKVSDKSPVTNDPVYVHPKRQHRLPKEWRIVERQSDAWLLMGHDKSARPKITAEVEIQKKDEQLRFQIPYIKNLDQIPREICKVCAGEKSLKSCGGYWEAGLAGFTKHKKCALEWKLHANCAPYKPLPQKIHGSTATVYQCASCAFEQCAQVQTRLQDLRRSKKSFTDSLKACGMELDCMFCLHKGKGISSSVTLDGIHECKLFGGEPLCIGCANHLLSWCIIYMTEHIKVLDAETLHSWSQLCLQRLEYIAEEDDDTPLVAKNTFQGDKDRYAAQMLPFFLSRENEELNISVTQVHDITGFGIQKLETFIQRCVQEPCSRRNVDFTTFVYEATQNVHEDLRNWRGQILQNLTVGNCNKKGVCFACLLKESKDCAKVGKVGTALLNKVFLRLVDSQYSTALHMIHRNLSTGSMDFETLGMLHDYPQYFIISAENFEKARANKMLIKQEEFVSESPENHIILMRFKAHMSTTILQTRPCYKCGKKTLDKDPQCHTCWCFYHTECTKQLEGHRFVKENHKRIFFCSENCSVQRHLAAAFANEVSPHANDATNVDVVEDDSDVDMEVVEDDSDEDEEDEDEEDGDSDDSMEEDGDEPYDSNVSEGEWTDFSESD